MTFEGKLLKCDRCGKTTFVERSGTQHNVIDGYVEESPTYQNADPNWAYLRNYPEPQDFQRSGGLPFLKTEFTTKLLCPKCRDEFTDLMYKFWRIGDE